MGLDNKKFLFIALAPTGEGLSGSDRIFIELARNWSKDFSIEVVTTSEGHEMMKRQKLFGKNLKIKIMDKNLPAHFFLKYLHKIFLGIKYGLNQQLSGSEKTFIYSSSDFWMDVLPAMFIKLRYPLVKWIATWYQTAPNPLVGFSEQVSRKEKYRFRAFLYWISQLPIKPLVKIFADYVIVNNENERKHFNEMDRRKKVIVLIGAVRLDDLKEYRKKHKHERKIYDAVFQGRFHPQKGVVELIEIWRKVVDKRENARIALIGDGPLMDEVKIRISKYRLDENIELFGYVFDGPTKYKIFSQSKLVLHPSFYDSGGMAAAEVMAFGVPAVGFNLEAYGSYYPKGMVKVNIGDLNSFAESILGLLENGRKRKALGQEALDMINDNWSWDNRAKSLLEILS